MKDEPAGVGNQARWEPTRNQMPERSSCPELKRPVGQATAEPWPDAASDAGPVSARRANTRSIAL